jgi:hypothetical protein
MGEPPQRFDPTGDVDVDVDDAGATTAPSGKAASSPFQNRPFPLEFDVQPHTGRGDDDPNHEDEQSPFAWMVIGTINNAMEGAAVFNMAHTENGESSARRSEALAKESSFLNCAPKGEVDMLLPCIPGSWRAARLFNLAYRKEGCDFVPLADPDTNLVSHQSDKNPPPFGAIFWHSESVGPLCSDAAALIDKMDELGGREGHTDITEDLKRFGVHRTIDRGDWEPWGVPERLMLGDRPVHQQQFDGGPFTWCTCFFVSPQGFQHEVLPAVRAMAEARTEAPFVLSGIGDHGAVADIPEQDYMCGRAFLACDAEGNDIRGVRAFIFYSYCQPDEWSACAVESAVVGGTAITLPSEPSASTAGKPTPKKQQKKKNRRRRR